MVSRSINQPERSSKTHERAFQNEAPSATIKYAICQRYLRGLESVAPACLAPKRCVIALKSLYSRPSSFECPLTRSLSLAVVGKTNPLVGARIVTFILSRSNVATGPRRKRKTGQRRLAARATTTKAVGYRKGSEKETLIRSPTTLTHLQWRISM